jgi:arylsulfatase A-like enzyme
MQINRREILNLGLLLPFIKSPFHFRVPENINRESDRPNFLIIVFDALSGSNCSIFGYPRNTTELLERICGKAIVYHNHYASSTYTTPGTASLLAGTLPWTHRAINHHDEDAKPLAKRNIFNLFSSDYHSVAYTHNPLADVLLRQFFPDIYTYIPREKLFLTNYWVSELFINDFNIAYIGTLNAIEDYRTVVKSSVYLSQIHEYFYKPLQNKAAKPYAPDFPRGVPNVLGRYYLLEQGIDWLINNCIELQQPYLGYFHFLPPHEPYQTRKEFINYYFGDNYVPVKKPEHFFTLGRNNHRLQRDRRFYDEFIKYVDSEFNRLYEGLEASGALENTWLILTTDHGEMFERGILGHSGFTLHQPIARVPLVIIPPDQTARVDITTATSAVDLIPTLLHIAGKPIPDWAEGVVLPPFVQPEENRPVYAALGRNNNQLKPFGSLTGMIVQDNQKLIHYSGYSALKGETLNELYDLNNDPEELNNLYSEDNSLAKALLDNLLDAYSKAEAPYR